MSEPFDTAWALLKAPFHGTTTDVLDKIKEQGLKPMQASPFDEAKIYYSKSPRTALAFSKIRSELKDEYTGKERGDPVLIQFPQDAVVVPNEADQKTHYAYTYNPIPPDKLKYFFGPSKSDYENFDEEGWYEWTEAMDNWKKEINEMYERGEFDD